MQRNIRGKLKMRKFFLSWSINIISFFIVSRLINGFHFQNFMSIFLTSIAFGIVNAMLKPLLIFLSLPFMLVTFGIFLFVINAALLEVVAFFVRGFSIDSFLTAIVGSLLLSLISFIISLIVFPKRVRI
ncbi:MAG: phage holin family protein [Caldiserica bacterium CG17_big_fil_post_rev_8_21_14_2_50_35_7]|jgi:putative membrane protein|nr:MAG: phage holin family protein [Caldiserica bacterium CG17_big_fil_post_rev_8_21_14_2_50_35_7]